jgi:hypothetical protein
VDTKLSKENVASVFWVIQTHGMGRGDETQPDPTEVMVK